MQIVKKIYLLIVSLFVGLTLVNAQETNNAIFWEISGNNLQKPSYLFGTHHLYNYQFIEKNENILTALKSVDIVLGEIAIDSSNTPNMLLKFTMAMMMPDRSLKSLLTPEQYKEVDKCLRENMGIGIATFNNIKPIFIHQLLTMAKFMKGQEKENIPIPKGLENPIGNSMDGFFQQKGKEFGKQVAGLESVDDQLRALYEGYTLERQVEMLMEMVHDQESQSTEDVFALTNMYEEQNLEGLLALMEKTTQPEELDALLVQRNNNWVPQIDNYLKLNQTLFIAVGAGHLPANYGLIAQLRKKGYTLTPLKISIKSEK